MGGLSPREVDKLNPNVIQELLWIDKCVIEKEEREARKG